MSNNTQGDSSTQLQSTIEVTTDQILKFPETPSDLLVTGSALVAVVILALYLKKVFKICKFIQNKLFLDLIERTRILKGK